MDTTNTNTSYRDYYDNGINLDGIDNIDILRAFAQAIDNHTRIEGRLLFPDMPVNYISATKQLKNYAWNKLTAMILRKEGYIERAKVYEDICEKVYNRLPEFAKW